MAAGARRRSAPACRRGANGSGWRTGSASASPSRRRLRAATGCAPSHGRPAADAQAPVVDLLERHGAVVEAPVDRRRRAAVVAVDVERAQRMLTMKSPAVKLRVHDADGCTDRSRARPPADVVDAPRVAAAGDDVDRAGDRARAGLGGRRAQDLDPLDLVGRRANRARSLAARARRRAGSGCSRCRGRAARIAPPRPGRPWIVTPGSRCRTSPSVESPKRSISSRPTMILAAVELRRSWTSSGRLPVICTGAWASALSRAGPPAPSPARRRRVGASRRARDGRRRRVAACADATPLASTAHKRRARPPRARRSARASVPASCIRGQSIERAPAPAPGLTRHARRSSAAQRPTARSSSALVIFERPLMFAFAASA